MAIIYACSNVQNCLKRKDFTEQSSENFKKSQADHFKLINEAVESEPQTIIEWLDRLKTLSIQSEADSVGFSLTNTQDNH